MQTSTPLKLIIEIDPETASIRPIVLKRPGSRPGDGQQERNRIWKGLLEYSDDNGRPMPVCEFLAMAKERAPLHLKRGGLEDIRKYLEEKSVDLVGAKYRLIPRRGADD